MKRIKTGVALATLMVGGACVSAADGIVPDAQPMREQFGIVDASGRALGASFVAPSGDGWRKSRPGGGIHLRKQGNASGENWEIEAYFIRPELPPQAQEAFAAAIRHNILQGYASGSRFKVANLTVAPDAHDPRCVRTHLLLQRLSAEEQGASESSTAWSEQLARSCGFRGHANWGVELRYYHRFTGTRTDTEFVERAGRLLDSLALIED